MHPPDCSLAPLPGAETLFCVFVLSKFRPGDVDEIYSADYPELGRRVGHRQGRHGESRICHESYNSPKR